MSHISLIQGLSPGLCVKESPVRFQACISISAHNFILQAPCRRNMHHKKF